jgi:hypothetical protein
MTVRKVDSGYATVHCHGKKKGKIISKFKTKKEALAQHRAIMASKHHSAANGSFLDIRIRKFMGG